MRRTLRGPAGAWGGAWELALGQRADLVGGDVRLANGVELRATSAEMFGIGCLSFIQI